MEYYIEIQDKDFAFQNRLQTFSLINHGYKDVSYFLNDAFELFEKRIHQILLEHYIVKITACFHGIFEKTVISEEGEKKETQPIYLHTNSAIIDFETSIRGIYDDTISSFIKSRA